MTMVACASVKKTSTEPTILTGKIFSANSSLAWTHELAEKANCVVNLESFQKELKDKKSFDMSEASGSDVLRDLMNKSVVIRTYKTKNPWSKAIATTYKTVPHDVYFNRYRNPREMQYMVNTAVHEATHLSHYSHGDNSNVGKENTVPYWTGRLAQKHYAYCN